MHLNSNIINIGIVTDFLSLSDSPHKAGVRLDDIQCLLFKVLPVAPASIETFSRCHRYTYITCYFILQGNI